MGIFDFLLPDPTDPSAQIDPEEEYRSLLARHAAQPSAGQYWDASKRVFEGYADGILDQIGQRYDDARAITHGEWRDPVPLAADTASLMAGTGVTAAMGRPGTSLGVFGGKFAENANINDVRYFLRNEVKGDRAQYRDLWRETGIGRHPTQSDEIMWEIPDDTARFLDVEEVDNGIATRILGGEEVPLPDFYDHPALYDNYPDIKDTKFKFFDAKNDPDPRLRDARGYFDPGANLIGLANDLSDRSAKKTITHELQHRISDIERWPQGGNPSSNIFTSQAYSAALKEEARANQLAAERRQWMDDEWGRHIRERIEPPGGFNRQSFRLMWNDKFPEKAAELWQAAARSGKWSSPFSAYTHTTDEALARLATDRIPLTAEARRNILPIDNLSVMQEYPVQHPSLLFNIPHPKKRNIPIR